MSRSVDERVVQMQFDNQKFEQKVSTTLGTLDKLKSALNFDKQAQSLDKLEKTAGAFNLSEMAANIQSIASHFTTFGIVGDQVIRRITDGFLNLSGTVRRTVEDLTLKQVQAGWGKYADKTAAVQTIMAATAKDFTDTGEQMDYVNGQLEKLNWFTDETSYSFLDMTSNIGKFTSNNIPLEKSVTAMQGISTWAAISGANTQEASRAMYNLSQAIAVGSVKLMDWKSIENANMATAGFKETVIDTAVAMGTLTKSGDGVYKTMKGNEVSVSNFNSALSDCWFTSEVLLASLDKYGGFTDKLYEVADITGLTATELLQNIDKYQEGTLNLDRLASKTGVSVEELDTMMKELSSDTYDLGRKAFRAAQEAKTFQEAIDATKDAVSTGWMNTFELIFGNYQEAKGLWTDIANGLYDIFAAGAESRNELLEAWHNEASQDGTYYQTFAISITDILTGLVEIKELTQEIFGDILPNVDLSTLINATEAFRNLSSNFKNFFDQDYVDDWTEKIESAKELDDGSFSIKDGGFISKEAYEHMAQFVTNANNFRDALSGVAHFVNILRKGFLTLTNSLSPLKEVFSSIVNGALTIGGAFGRLLEKIDSVVNITDGFKSIMESLSKSISGFIDTGAGTIGAFFDSLAGAIGVGEKIKQIPEALADIPKGVKSVKSLLNPIRMLDTSTGSLAYKFGDAIKGINDGFGKKELIDRLYSLDNATGSVGESVSGMSKFVSGAVKTVGEFGETIRETKAKVVEFVGSHMESFKNTFKGIESIFSLLGKGISATLKLLPNIVDLFGKAFGWVINATGAIGNFFTKINSGTGATVKFTGLLDFIKQALDKIGEIISPITNKIAEMFDLLSSGNFEGFKNLMQGLQAGGSFLVFNKLSGGIQSLLGSAEDAVKGKGLINNIKSAFGAVADGINKLIGGEDDSKSKQILNMGIAIGILAGSMLLLSTIDPKALTVGITGLSVVFAELIGFMTALNAISNQKGNVGQLTKSLTKISGAIIIFALSLKILSTIKMEELGVALLGMTGIFALISGFFYALKQIGGKKGIKDVKNIAKAMKTIGTAMILLAAAMKIFATMSWDDLGRGLVAIGGLFTELAAFFAVMNIIMEGTGAGKLILLSVALTVISGAMIILAGAVAMFSLLSWEGLAKAGVAIAGFFLILAGFSAVMATIGPALLLGAAALAVVSPAMVLLAGAMLLFSKIQKPGKAILGLGGALLVLAIGLTLMIAALPGALALDVTAKALIKLIAPIAAIMALGVGKFTLALIAMAGALAVLGLAGILLIPGSVGLIGLAGSLLVFAAAAAVAGVAITLVAAGFTALAGATVAGATSFVAALGTIIVGIGDLASGAVESIAKVIIAIVDAIILAVPKILEGVGVVIFAVLDFIDQNIGPIVEKVISICVNIINAIAEKIPDIIDAGINLMVSFINGMAEGIREHTDDILLAIGNLLSAIIEFVLSTIQALVRGIPGIGKKLDYALEQLKGNVRNTLSPEEGIKIADDFTDATVSEIDNKRIDARLASEGFGESMVDRLNNMNPKFATTGKTSADAYLNGFSVGGQGKAASAADNVGSGVVNELASYKSSMSSTGENLVAGLAKGILNRKWETDDAADSVANSVIRRTKSRMQIQSPSRVAMEIGKYWDEGQAIGMRKNISVVEDAADEVANRPISSLKEALTRFSGIVSEDLDTAPVIRPVLDLSNVKAEAGKINKMFSNQNGSVSLVDPHKIAITPGFLGSGPVTTSNYGGFNISVNANTNDPQKLAREIMEEIQYEIDKKEAALA